MVQESLPHLIELLPEKLSFADRPSAPELQQLPSHAAVYTLLDGQGRAVFLSTTQHLRRLSLARLDRRPTDAGLSRRTDLAEETRAVRWRQVHSRFEADWWYLRLARALHPDDYRARVGFGPAWYLHFDPGAPIPELRISEQIWRAPGRFLGPMPTRADAQQLLEALWDLFDLCRYPEQIRRTPLGRRCAYADMGRCDAPCDGSVPLRTYRLRCESAWRFALGESTDWLADAEARMHAAASELQFERAAQIKEQIALVRRRRTPSPECMLTDDVMNLLLLAPAVRRRAWKPFLFRRGALSDGPLIGESVLPVRVLSWLRETWERTAEDQDPTLRMEQSWLLASHLDPRRKSGIGAVRLGSALPQDVEARIDSVRSALRAAGSGGAPNAESPIDDSQ